MADISFTHTFQDGDTLFGTDLETLKAAITAQVNGNLDNDNISATAAIEPSKIDGYSDDLTEMRTQTDPYPSSAESQASDLRGELARIRFVLKTMLGKTYWYQGSVQGVQAFTTGDVKATLKSSADTGWVMLDDGTIGDGSSNATSRDNDDTSDLFTLLWTNFDNTKCPIFDSGGVASSRGATAAADFAAHKALRLPLVAGRVLGAAGTPAAANTIDAATYACSGSASATDIKMAANQKFLTDDVINGWTLTVTSGARNGQSATVTDYVASANDVNGIITVGAGLSGALTSGDTFTLTKAVATRSLGDTVGKTDIIGIGSNSLATTGADWDGIGGYGSTAATTVSPHETTNYPPTWFGNFMVKL